MDERESPTNAANCIDGTVTPEYLARLKTGEFLMPDEAAAMIWNLGGAIDSDFCDAAAEAFKLTEDDAIAPGVDVDSLTTPEDFAGNINPAWQRVERRRSWYANVLRRAEQLADEHEIDKRPLLWLARYVYCGEPRSEQEKRDIRDCVSLLGRTVDRGQPTSQPDAADAAPPGDTGQAKNERPELVTIKEMVLLSDGIVAEQTTANRNYQKKNRPTPKIPPRGSNPAKYDFAQLRAWMLEEWPDTAMFIPSSYSEARSRIGKLSKK